MKAADELARGRAQRLLARQQFDCAERGYLMVPAVMQSRSAATIMPRTPPQPAPLSY
jgi:hypothetical protein